MKSFEIGKERGISAKNEFAIQNENWTCQVFKRFVQKKFQFSFKKLTPNYKRKYTLCGKKKMTRTKKIGKMVKEIV